MVNNLEILNELNSTIAQLVNDEYVGIINELTTSVENLKAAIGSELYQYFQKVENEQTSFTQRVLTDHLESMENIGGFPPRHPIHWLQEQSDDQELTEILFNQKESATEFIQEILKYITEAIGDRFGSIENNLSKVIDHRVTVIRQQLSIQLNETSNDPRLLMANYIASSVPNPSLKLKEHQKFYLLRNGKRVNNNELMTAVSTEIKPWYSLGLSKKLTNKYQVKYEAFQRISADSIDRCLNNLTNILQDYFQQRLPEQISNLYQQTCELK